MIWILAVGKANYDSKLDLAMVSRAFGASNITFCPGEKDGKRLIKYCQAMSRRWGGNFGVSYTDDWKRFIAERKNYLKIYLTRYGMSMTKLGYQVRTYKNVLAIVSFTESIKPLYDAADFNMSITTQPHSCSSSVAVFLHEFYSGRELSMHFENAKYKINPGDHGVRVKKL